MTSLAALISVSSGVGLPALAVLVCGECLGLPIPGETALILAGGHRALGPVILVATFAAILGDTLGYVIGRRAGRTLIDRDGLLAGRRRRLLAASDRYFARHGALTVFVARWLPGLRVGGALAAGASQMRWRRFAPANAAGALGWSASVATVAHLAGPTGSLILAIGAWTFALLLVVAGWLRRRGGVPASADADGPTEARAAPPTTRAA